MKILISLVISLLIPLLLISCSEHSTKGVDAESLNKIQGDYQGSGTFNTGAATTTCETARLVISTTDNTLSIESIEFICAGNVAFETKNPMKFDVSAGELKVNGTKFGTYTPTTGFTLDYVDVPGGNVRYTLNFQSNTSPYKLLMTETKNGITKKLTANLNKRPL